ncbi:hypothetical protein Sjap_015986 [Stephania japonica]|uniref:Snakin-2 n=1 Tax=Stephania japonica TaxID=461633 RepID=A0AAP0NT21_9MAGN
MALPVFLVLSLLLLSFTYEVSNVEGGIDCGGLCGVRCGAHSRPNVCMRACGTCCARCGCVPPGTYGNREMCGRCYTDMTTHDNKTKCP